MNILQSIRPRRKQRILFFLPDQKNLNYTPLKSLPMSIVDKSQPYGIIRFIHADGKEHSFWTAVNDLSRSRLSAFDGKPPDIDQSLSYLKSVFADIRQKSKVISYEGTKHFK